MASQPYSRWAVLARFLCWILAAPGVFLLSGDWYFLTAWMVGGVGWLLWRLVKEPKGGQFEEKANLSLVVALLGLALNLGGGGRFFYLVFGGVSTILGILLVLGIGIWVRKNDLNRDGGFFLKKSEGVFLVFGLIGISAVFTGFPLIPFSVVLWVLVAIPIFLVGKLWVPLWLRLSAVVNLILMAAFGGFYVDPLEKQVKRVADQPGVTVLIQKRQAEFRWAREGCSEGSYWFGQKHVLSEKSPSVAALYRNEQMVFKGGYSTDNGAVDCEKAWVMFGAKDPSGLDNSHASSGRLVVLNEKTGELIFESKTRYKYTGLDYDFKRKLLLATRETDPPMVVLDLKDLALVGDVRPEVKSNAAAFCQEKTNCFISLEPGKVRRHTGEKFEKILEKRLPSMAIPQLTVVGKGKEVWVSQFYMGSVLVLNPKTLEEVPGSRVSGVRGIRYLKWWPKMGVVVGAGYADGFLYALRHGEKPKPIIFMGKKSRELNLSRDGKSLLWCAASACFSYQPREKWVD